VQRTALSSVTRRWTGKGKGEHKIKIYKPKHLCSYDQGCGDKVDQAVRATVKLQALFTHTSS